MSKPLQPQSVCDGPSPLDSLRQEAKALRVLLAAERRRHAGIEALTMRLVLQLERQVTDLRTLYFNNIEIKTTEKK